MRGARAEGPAGSRVIHCSADPAPRCPAPTGDSCSRLAAPGGPCKPSPPRITSAATGLIIPSAHARVTGHCADSPFPGGVRLPHPCPLAHKSGRVNGREIPHRPDGGTAGSRPGCWVIADNFKKQIETSRQWRLIPSDLANLKQSKNPGSCLTVHATTLVALLNTMELAWRRCVLISSNPFRAPLRGKKSCSLCNGLFHARSCGVNPSHCHPPSYNGPSA
ncbi:hypothetical protein B0I37DRAFT_372758 [Chaetomium sp. MPI-CAGE-AT-0009]|nr:hypothetical protein B0I37DRAFT_372758 [Chaetomium sp. MPI-CAGE-AT-0009]